MSLKLYLNMQIPLSSHFFTRDRFPLLLCRVSHQSCLETFPDVSGMECLSSCMTAKDCFDGLYKPNTIKYEKKTCQHDK